MSTHSSRDYL